MSKPKKFVVQLTDDDVRYLKKLRKKKSTSQTIANRCNILLAMDENHPPTKTYTQRQSTAKIVQEEQERTKLVNTSLSQTRLTDRNCTVVGKK